MTRAADGEGASLGIGDNKPSADSSVVAIEHGGTRRSGRTEGDNCRFDGRSVYFPDMEGGCVIVRVETMKVS